MLEACCGTGEVTGALKRPGVETHGLDISSGMLAQAAARIGRLKRGDAHRLPYGDGFFDVVVTRQAIQFLRPADFFREVLRVLKPGGTFLFSNHVPRSAAQRPRLLRIYRLIQPSGIFCDPSKLYLGGELRALLCRAGLKVEREETCHTSEPLDALMACYPNLTKRQKDAIVGEYLKSPALLARAAGLPRASWKWVIFAARKPAALNSKKGNGR